jgi:predicted RNase H-like nuclease
MQYVGLDGYPKGWVAVWLYDGSHTLSHYEKIEGLLTSKFDCAMIDMPIGLPDHGYRECDEAARRMLKPHASRVFLGARRPLLEYDDYPSANAALKARDGKGISRQLYGIKQKLKEVDTALNPALQARVMECHPELVFLRLNGSKPLAKKKTAEGIALRIRLLRDRGLSAVESWIRTRKPYVKVDDILDACACALAARDRTPDRPPLGGKPDRTGLKMEIHY